MLNFIKQEVETNAVELTDEQLEAVTGGHAVKHSSKHSKHSNHSKHSKHNKHNKHNKHHGHVHTMHSTN